MAIEPDKVRRVVFSFGPDSLSRLDELIAQGFEFTVVRLRNPQTGEERELIIPTNTSTRQTI